MNFIEILFYGSIGIVLLQILLFVILLFKIPSQSKIARNLEIQLMATAEITRELKEIKNKLEK